jgi:hypothetical protein
MKKERMKSLFYLFTFILIYLIAACTQDAYEKGEGELSQMTAEMGDGYTSTEKKVTRFVTDDDVELTVATPFSTKIMPKADTVYRAVFYYAKTGEQAEVKGLNPVGVIRPRAIAIDSLKTDPVKLESVWMGKSRRYINLSVYIMLGTNENDSVKQKLGCHRDTLIQNADSTRTLRLMLYHDQATVPQYYSQRTYLSIPTKGLDADSVELTVNTYNGAIVKRLKL